MRKDKKFWGVKDWTLAYRELEEENIKLRKAAGLNISRDEMREKCHTAAEDLIKSWLTMANAKDFLWLSDIKVEALRDLISLNLYYATLSAGAVKKQ